MQKEGDGPESRGMREEVGRVRTPAKKMYAPIVRPANADVNALELLLAMVMISSGPTVPLQK
jgi:hypothetical protein